MATKAGEYEGINQDRPDALDGAVPLTLGQEFSGYVARSTTASNSFAVRWTGLYEAGARRTASANRAECPAGFAEKAAERITRVDGQPFVSARTSSPPSPGTSEGDASGALRTLGLRLMKIANTSAGWVRPAVRLAELRPAGERARLVDHARQGEPDPERALTMVCLPAWATTWPSASPVAREFRAERVQAGDRVQRAELDPPPGRRVRSSTALCRGLMPDRERIGQYVAIR